MTLDFTSLTPCPAPKHIPAQAIRLGPADRVSSTQLLSQLETLLGKPGPGAALVLKTSGSTGQAKQTALSSRALLSSAQALHARLGLDRPQWLLALPTYYIAGLQVLARSVYAGTSPLLTSSVSEGSSFSQQDFLAKTQQLTGRQRMLSLVPTQLYKLLQAGEFYRDSLEALRSFKAVLLGGAPASRSLLARARAAGIRVVTTYGSTETAGGCVYDGLALEGIQLACQPLDAQELTPSLPAFGPASQLATVGRIWLGGEQLALGYVGDEWGSQQHFFVDRQNRRWYRSDDLGSLSSGRLQVLGRLDDVIISGGLKIAAGPVASLLESHPQVQEAYVCGLADDRWGNLLAAAVCLSPEADQTQVSQDLAQLLAGLPSPQRPKLLKYFWDFPTLATGKTDRAALKELLALPGQGITQPKI
ncbi:MAG: AMP-binding protein [Rothia sp. (in: high G+C Gram-positive bacteria)]|nr:AMP-binding protein [Rothia sp. (in: high G+C Gram-positive bacteria)]